MRVRLLKEFVFEAAHGLPEGGDRYTRLHGHSWLAELVAEGDVDPVTGWLVDFADLKEPFLPIYRQLDHSYLNDIEGLDATTPGTVAQWIKMRLQPQAPLVTDVIVSIIGDNDFVLRRLPEDVPHSLPERWRFTFEAAQSLPHLPVGHPCRALHGHSYRIEVGAVDIERLRVPLRSIYDELDHRCLNDIPGLQRATCEVICRWMWERLERDIPDLRVVVVQETDTARSVYYGD